jgi:serine/threonine protein kinase
MSAIPTAQAPWCKPSSSSWVFAPGATLVPGRRVIRRVGHGGAHEAFLIDTGGRRSQAVAKLPRPHLVDDAYCLLGLEHEAHALDRLAHPALPRHLDTLLTGPHPHLLLEYVPGSTLQDALVRRRSLDPPIVAGVGCAIARALDHIAAAGWVHLDVKPSNIVLNLSPRLLDFELARPAADAAGMTKPTGTWAFMSPEQRAPGGAQTLGPPADVFALAVSLGEALLGGPLIAPSGRRPAELPGSLGALLGEALATAPEQRPTAGELAAALAELAEPITPVTAAA